LNFSDRGGAGGNGQAALASNLMHAGMSLAGLMAWEDLRAAEFLAQQPEVDPARIGAIGMSMGALRTWQLAALSDHIRAAAAICWMTTANSLMQAGNNQTVSQSTYTTLHPGLLGELDYADFASLACPKPMLFFNGREDLLFPQAGVEDAYAKLHAVWNSQGVSAQLVTRTWAGRHVFAIAMQEAAFAWLDEALAVAPTNAVAGN
jgi:dienelactone hydrolase